MYLAGEPDLLRTLYAAFKEAESEEDPLLLDADPRLTMLLLTSARSEGRSQAMGTICSTQATSRMRRAD